MFVIDKNQILSQTTTGSILDIVILLIKVRLDESIRNPRKVTQTRSFLSVLIEK